MCKAFRARGHRAFSCDIQECSGGHPEWHIQDDVLRILNGYKGGGYGCPWFTTNDGKNHDTPERWDLIIAHPPCTYLTVSGNSWFDVQKYGDKARQRYKDRYAAIVFFMQMATASAPMVAVENPVGIMATAYRKPDQIIQPYEYGHHARKATCLWLKGLPKLTPTDIVSPGEIRNGGFSVGAHADGKDSQGKWLRYSDPELAKLRSRTFPGIAAAMAEQWG